jgi:phage terminase large subunit-like protein
MPKLPISDDPGALALDFFTRYLRHSKGEWGPQMRSDGSFSAGKPFELAPWQRERIIRPLFGTLRSDGLRQYRTVFVFIPRKNGKSTLAAGIACKAAFADHEPGAEVYSAAADREQAAIVFDQARSMIEASPELERRAEVFRRQINTPNKSFYRVVSSDSGTKHGYNAHAVIIDELHAHKNRELFDVLTTSQGSRRQPLIVIITTAGVGMDSVCRAEYDYACKVRDGHVVDPTYLPVIFEAPQDADWHDPATWAVANPNLGISLRPEELERQHAQAKEMPAKQNAFRRLHLNQWTQQETRWIDMDAWKASAGEADPLALQGRACWAGLDLAATTDTNAFAMCFPLAGGFFKFLVHYWIPAKKFYERIEKYRIPLDVWHEDGWITITPGEVADYDQIRSDINEFSKRYKVQEIGVDEWNATQLSTQLTDDGHAIVWMRQGTKTFNPLMQDWERLIAERRLHHGGNPVLDWQASNVNVAVNSQGWMRPVRDDKRVLTIDGVVAALMALGRTQAGKRSTSKYDGTRGIAWVG